MNEDVQEKAIAEAYHVLKEKGKLSIWDVEIDFAYPEPFLADLDIQFEDKDIHATLGIEGSNLSLFRELASHGYIIASLGHPYHSFITTLSDGSDIYVDSSFFQNVMNSQESDDLEQTREDFNEWKSIRVEDISFVLDSILSDEKYSSKIDKERYSYRVTH